MLLLETIIFFTWLYQDSKSCGSYFESHREGFRFQDAPTLVSQFTFTVYSKSYSISLYDALSFPFAFSVASGGFFDISPIIFMFR